MKDFLKALHILSDEEIRDMDGLGYKKTIAKNDFLIQEDAVCTEIVFVQSGILRSFYISDEGEEMTNCITFENEFMSAYSSFITQTPTQENIQALTETHLWVINRTELLQLYKKSMGWQEIGRMLAEMQYIQLEQRLLSFQKQNAKQRYQALLLNHPNYIQYIPLNHLASFLGITTRHLSRLRKEISL